MDKGICHAHFRISQAIPNSSKMPLISKLGDKQKVRNVSTVGSQIIGRPLE
jgi:hypothetical protein